MKPLDSLLTRCAILGIISFVTCASALAQYDLSRWTVDGGGEMWTAGGDFELSGTIGQPDAGVMAGGDFELTGGFWGVSFAESEPIPGDVDGDGDVDLADLAALLASYGACEGDSEFDPAADLDGSGCVDLLDLAILLAHYGEGT